MNDIINSPEQLAAAGCSPRELDTGTRPMIQSAMLTTESTPRATLIVPDCILPGARLLVQQDPAPETSGALHLPGEARVRPLTGVVAKVGFTVNAPDDEDEPILDIGSRVMWAYDPPDQARIRIGGVEYVLLEHDDIAVILPSED